MVSHSFLPTIGGAELVVHNLSKHLAKSGEDVFVFTHHKKDKTTFQSNYNIQYYPRTPKEIAQGYTFAISLLLMKIKLNFNLIHVHVAKIGYYATKIKRLLNVPIVITTHGRDIQKYHEIGYGFRLDPKWNRRIEYALKNADLVTAIGSSTNREYLNMGISRERIADIPNGVDFKRFNEPHQNIREILGLSEDTKIVLGVGRYDQKKGYEYLISAIPSICKNVSKVKFLLIGKGLSILKPLIQEMSIQQHVITIEQQSFNKNDSSIIDLNKIPNDTLLSAYKSADVFVSPSLIEGFALVIIEAMACGLPIVATNVPGNEDAIVNEKNGFLVPPMKPGALSEKIIEVLNNDRRRVSFGENSKEMSRQYDWEKISNEYLSQYKKLIKQYGEKN
jgi:glycosyltransferase involved in cell wall biosynthesis